MTKFLKSLALSVFIISLVGLAGTRSTFAASTPSLGAAASYAVLSSTYTNTSVVTINGDVGFTTGPAVTPLGLHPYYGSVTPYATAGIDQGSALSALNAEACDFIFGVPTDLSLEPQPLVPGVYCISAATTIGTSGITLSGAGTYIFRIDGAFDTIVNSNVTLTNGASACDIFWTPSSAATLAADTTFKGTLIDDAGITVGANVIWAGRAMSFGETVTTDTATITNTCTPSASALHLAKLVINANGGASVAADFSLHVVLSGGSDVPGSPSFGVVTPGSMYALYSGTYVVSEDIRSSYAASFTGDCDANGVVVLGAGDDKTCIMINTHINNAGGGQVSSINSTSSVTPSPIVPLPSPLTPPAVITPPMPSPSTPGTVDTSYRPTPYVFGPAITLDGQTPFTLPNQLPQTGARGVQTSSLWSKIITAIGNIFSL